MDISILGIPEEKIKQFRKKKINTIEELVHFFPKDYIDTSRAIPADKVTEGKFSVLLVKVIKINTFYNGSGIQIYAKDTITNSFVVISYFNASYMADNIFTGRNYYVIGKFKVTRNNNNVTIYISNPFKMTDDLRGLPRIMPVYKKIAGMSDTYLETCIMAALSHYHPNEYLYGSLMEQERIVSVKNAVKSMHFPESVEALKNAKTRLLFDDLFFFNVMLKEKSLSQNPASPFKFKSGNLARDYISALPFELTEGQKKAVSEIYKDGAAGRRISALLLADVGYGKTECAKILSLFGVEAGCQSVVLAPTMVLAQQHYHDFQDSLRPFGIKVGYLSSDVKAAERKKILKELKSGTIQVLIGTHSCLSNSVQYHNLGILVVDEEHKFGVKQREKLTVMASRGVHSLSMSATPIPRSMAIAMYGDGVDIIEIKTAPGFKKPIKTKIVSDDKEIFSEILPELKAGHQAYVVCPLIEDSESEKTKDVESVKKVVQTYEKELSKYGYKVEMLNGKMKATEIKEVIDRFASGQTHVLISTTVIEVGVNVKNATVMVVKNAERFGLAQLHQLRGRVGRGFAQGICLLQTEDENSKNTLEIMVQSNDGFVIAQKDLENRGAGDFIGTAQSGANTYFEETIKFPKYNLHIKSLVDNLYENDNVKNYIEEVFAGSILEAAADNPVPVSGKTPA